MLNALTLRTHIYSRASLIAQSVKNLPAVHEIWVEFLGWKDPLEKEMATHSNILSWKKTWTEGPNRLQSMGSKESYSLEQLHFHFHVPK